MVGVEGEGGGGDDEPASGLGPDAAPAVALTLVSVATGAGVFSDASAPPPRASPPAPLHAQAALSLAARLMPLPPLGPHILAAAAGFVQACVRCALEEAASGGEEAGPHCASLSVVLELATHAAGALPDWVRAGDALPACALAACGAGVRGLVGAYRAAEAARVALGRADGGGGSGGRRASSSAVAALVAGVRAAVEAALTALQGEVE